MMGLSALKLFQQKCETVLRPEKRKKI